MLYQNPTTFRGFIVQKQQATKVQEPNKIWNKIAELGTWLYVLSTY